MTTQTSFDAPNPDNTAGRNGGMYADPSRNTKVGDAPIPPAKVAPDDVALDLNAAAHQTSGLLGWAYLVLLMTPVLWILLFVFADIVSAGGMWALPQRMDFLLTAAMLLAFSVPTVAVVVLALVAWRRERSWLAFPVTLAFGLQVFAAAELQTPVLLLITVGVGLVALPVAGRGSGRGTSGA